MTRKPSLETADVVVVGAGIVGASCALELTRKGLQVVVVEREGSPAMGSTGRSAAGVRVQFTTAANVGLSMYSLPVFREFEARYGADAGYRDLGYLLLVPENRWASHLEAVDLQRRLGAPVDVLTPAEANELTPIDASGLAGATFGPWDGVVDPHLVTAAWVARSRQEGARYHMGWGVTDVERQGEVWIVRSGDRQVEAAWLVNAAGAWSAEVAGLAGLALPVRPKRIQIFLSAPLDPGGRRPMTIDLATGVYMRSEGERILFGLDDLEQDFGFSEGIERTWLEHVLTTGVGRFPWWEEMGVDWKGSWWGYYAVTPDNSPVIAPHPDAEGWIDACGFSGHGIMHSPATGRAVAELIADGAATSVDVSAFTHGRFAAEGRWEAAEANIF